MLAAPIRSVLMATSALAAAIVLGACSSGGSTSAPGSGSRPTAATTLRILVANDDGYSAPGISAVTQALAQLPGVQVTVVAPDTNQSGTGGKTTEGTVRALAGHRLTAAGHAATAVVGFPADAVNYALDRMKLQPDVVVSGINQGQNLGSITSISGTVGAAERAATRGIPSIAVSQGLGADPQYPVAARLTAAWITDHRAALAAHRATVGVVNLNVPTCATGSLRGVRQVPLATSGDGAVDPADCTSTVTTVGTDIDAFHNGFAAVTQLTPTGQTVTSSTTFPATKAST